MIIESHLFWTYQNLWDVNSDYKMKSLLVHIKGKHNKRVWNMQTKRELHNPSIWCWSECQKSWWMLTANLFWDRDEGRPVVFHKHLFEKRMFLFVKTPGFVSITDTEPQKLLGARRRCSSYPPADQATLGACSFETDIKCNNAVLRLCFLETRKNTSATGKLCIYILTVDSFNLL